MNGKPNTRQLNNCSILAILNIHKVTRIKLLPKLCMTMSLEKENNVKMTWQMRGKLFTIKKISLTLAIKGTQSRYLNYLFAKVTEIDINHSMKIVKVLHKNYSRILMSVIPNTSNVTLTLKDAKVLNMPLMACMTVVRFL